MGELSSDVHLTPSQKYGVLPQSEYMEITGNRVVQNLSGNTMQHVEAGDFISHLRTFQGGLELARTPGKVSPAYTVVTPRSPAHSEYYKYVLKSAGYISQIASVTDQLRDGQSMRYSEFNHTWLPLPPLDEQQIIADYLDHETAEIDALIHAQHQTLVLLAERRRRVVDNHFPELMANSVALKRLGKLQSGLTIGTRYEEPVQTYPYLRVANVQAGHLDLSEIAEVSVPAEVASRTRLQAGDVLMTEGGDRDKLARGALWQGPVDPMLHQNHVFAFRSGPLLDPQFLVYCLESSRARTYFDITARKSTNLAATNSTIVKNFQIPRIPLGEQRKVVRELQSELAAMDKMATDARLVNDLANEHRAAVISTAVTGQIDVRERRRGTSEAERLESELARTQ